MPHCIVEYSAELTGKIDINNVLTSLYAVLEACGEFEISTIKLRAVAYADVFSGLNDHSFMHLRLHILSGRSQPQKLALTKAMLAQLSPELTMVKSLSAEVVDIQRDSYSKRVL